LCVGRVAEENNKVIDTTDMAFLQGHYVFVVCCSYFVSCNLQDATPLPTQCDNSVLELSPIDYVASGTNYSNCTLKGQPGTVIHGAIGDCDDTGRLPDMGVTTLAGFLVLDGVSVKTNILHITGNDITVRNSNITTCFPSQAFVAKGGKVNFDGVMYHTCTSLLSSFVLLDTTASFTRSYLSGVIFKVSNARVSMLNSSVLALDDQTVTLRASIINLTDSDLGLGHGHFSLLDSNATLSSSSVSVSMGTSGITIGRSTVVADCAASDPSFSIGTPNGNGVSIFDSRLTFHACSCDISRAIHIYGDGGEIDIDGGSVHFEGCMSPSPKKAYATLV